MEDVPEGASTDNGIGHARFRGLADVRGDAVQLLERPPPTSRASASRRDESAVHVKQDGDWVGQRPFNPLTSGETNRRRSTSNRRREPLRLVLYPSERPLEREVRACRRTDTARPNTREYAGGCGTPRQGSYLLRRVRRYRWRPRARGCLGCQPGGRHRRGREERPARPGWSGLPDRGEVALDPNDGHGDEVRGLQRSRGRARDVQGSRS